MMRQPDDFVAVNAEISNPGKPNKFKNYDAVGPVKSAMKTESELGGWSSESAKQLAEKIMAEVRAPFVKAYVSELGGSERASVMITIGLDPRESWRNGILENSRYAKLSYSGGRLYQHSGHGTVKFRKIATGPEKVVDKLNAWIQSNEAKTEARDAFIKAASQKLLERVLEGEGTPGFDVSPSEDFSAGQRVNLSWKDGSSNQGMVVSAENSTLIIQFEEDPDEEYEYEFRNGSWYEINNHFDPVTITPADQKRDEGKFSDWELVSRSRGKYQ